MRRALFVFLLAAAAASAEEGPADWISRLGDDDPAVREESQEKLLAAGEPALAPVEEALKTAKDPEVVKRLELVRTRLAREKQLAFLPEGWRDEWFRMTQERHWAGWAHISTAETAVNGRSAWIITLDRAHARGDTIKSHLTLVATCRRDPLMTPISCDVTEEIGETLVRYEMKFRDRAWESQFLEARGLSQDSISPVRERYTGTHEVDGAPQIALLLPRQIERLSRARVEAEIVPCLVIPQTQQTTDGRVDFIAEENVTVGGVDSAARHYSFTSSDGTDTQEFWVDDEKGLLLWKIGNEWTLEWSDEKAAKSRK